VERAAWGCWLALIAVISLLVALNPQAHSVLIFFRAGTQAWWAGQDIYSYGRHSFYYLPVFVLLFSPFHLLGMPLGDLLWRWISFAALTAGFWRLARMVEPNAWRPVLALVLVLALPGVAGMLRNGQATTIMIALMIHGAVDIAEERWTRASLWLGLAVALKPLAIVFVLLSVMLYGPLAWRLPIAMTVVLVAPFAFHDAGYVVHQYRGTVEEYALAYSDTFGPWSNLDMMLYRLGLPLPATVMTALRLAAALATLTLAYVARRLQPPSLASYYILALSVCYLMLFNPGNEENTFGALASILAVSAAAVLVNRKGGWVAWSLVVLCMALGSDGYGTIVFQATRLWFKPMVCIAYFVFLLPRLWARDVRIG
jgi:hypothetical protein